MKNAEDGAEIDLLHDVTVTDVALVLNADVVLDLNGYDLTIENYLLAFGHIADSTDGKGKLIIPRDNIKSILADNVCLPLYEGNGYRFYNYEFRHVEKPTSDPDTVQYSVGVGFTNKKAYDLLVADDVDFGVRMTVIQSDGKVRHITWVFSDALMRAFAEKNAVARTAITMTISGMENIEDATITAQAILISQDRVVNVVKNMITA